MKYLFYLFSVLFRRECSANLPENLVRSNEILESAAYTRMQTRSIALQDVKALSPAQKIILKKYDFKVVTDVILMPPGVISKWLKSSLNEVQSIIESLCKELAQSSLHVCEIEERADDKFTTGDAVLDRVVGGGIRTGMLWELAGESASGKTQLALQMCLLVQVVPTLGGLSGSACYLSTHGQLSTKRLKQLVDNHPLMSPSVCSLSDVHTVSVPTVELLMHTLTRTFPALQDQLHKEPARKPVRLIVIDSISALFHSSGKASSSSLFERSKALSELSRVMHEIATKENIAFVVINEVTDVFDDYYSENNAISKCDVVYRDQARWFNSAHSIPAESAKEACLGLVWANQLNARIMLTRTNRRKHLDDPYPLGKRRQLDGGSAASGDPSTSAGNEDDLDRAVLLRRFSVVFNSVSTPGSADFIVTNGGIAAVCDGSSVPFIMQGDHRDSNEDRSYVENRRSTAKRLPEVVTSSDNTYKQDAHANQRFINARMVSASTERRSSDNDGNESLEVIPSTYPEVDEFSDDAIYWEEFDQLPDDALLDVDFDGLERSQIEEDLQPSEPAQTTESR